jgi:SH3-like domain-containing protein
MTRFPPGVRLSRAMAGVAALFLCALLTAHPADADRVRTTKSTKVYKRTGEKSGIVTKVAKGKTLSVVATQGRWLKVRVNGRTGWVTRSSVVSLEARDVPRNTRRRPFVDGRSRRRGWAGSAPEDRVGADAVEDGDGDDGDVDDDETGRGSRASDDDDRRSRKKKSRSRDDDDDDDDDDDEDDDDDDDDDDDGADVDVLQTVTVSAKKAKLYPRMSKRARPSLTVRRGATLTVLDEHESGKWIRVEDDEGAAGWILADAVERPDRKRPGRTIAATARLGFAQVGGTFTSNGPVMAGGNPPPDYGFGSTAVSLAVGGELTMPMGKDYLVGGGLEYLGCVATPGIRYASGMMAEDIGFKTHDIDARLLGGYDFHKPNGMTAWGRLGYHYGVFSVSNLNNLAKLPAETFKGPTFGAALRIPRLARKIGGEASLDLVYPGRRKQTQGIEDGALQKAMAATAEVTALYDWKTDWKLGAAYRFGYAASSWTGTSARITGATAAKRTDLSHVLTVGLGRAF